MLCGLFPPFLRETSLFNLDKWYKKYCLFFYKRHVSYIPKFQIKKFSANWRNLEPAEIWADQFQLDPMPKTKTGQLVC